MNFYPGAVFAGLTGNAYPQAWRAWSSKGPSGSQWFAIHLDAIGIFWEVDYVTWGKRCAFMSTNEHRFYWPDGKPGLAWRVLRPLFLDWMLKGALAGEFGLDYMLGLATDPVLLYEFDDHQEEMAKLLETYEIGERGVSKN